jgi:hypothetical protein
MACCSPDKPEAKSNLRPEAVDAVMGGPCRPTPNYVGKVAYIMDGGDTASYGRGGLFFIVAQDGDRRIDAVLLQEGYNSHEIKRFNLQDNHKTLDSGKVQTTPAASVTQVREDNDFVLDWCRRQYRWGANPPLRDGKPQWCQSVFDGAKGTAELVFLTVERIIRENARAIRELQKSFQRQLDKAVKDELYRRSYGG